VRIAAGDLLPASFRHEERQRVDPKQYAGVGHDEESSSAFSEATEHRGRGLRPGAGSSVGFGQFACVSVHLDESLESGGGEGEGDSFGGSLGGGFDANGRVCAGRSK